MELKPGYKQTEVGIIPEDWDVVPVSKLGETKRGASSLCIKYRQSGGVRLIRINDFFQDKPVFVEPTAEIMRFALSERDLLFAGTGASAGASYLPKEEWLGLPHSYNAPRIRVFKDDSKEFLLYSLQSGYVLRQQRAWFVGNAQPFLDTKAISNFSIAVPKTSTEKCAIAEALSDVDALLGGMERLIVKKRDLKQAAMQQLLTGRQRLPGFHGEWEVTSFGNVVRHHAGNSALIKGKLPSSPSSGLYPGFSASGQDVWCDHYQHKGEAVVVSAVGSRCGKAFAASGKWCAIANTHVVWPNASKVDTRFLNFFINDEHFWLKSGSGQPFVLFKQTFARRLRLPSLPEQTAIASVLTDMDAELAALEQRREKTHALKQAMMQELLTGRTRLV